MSFGYLEFWWENIVVYTKGNFWSLLITIVVIIAIYSYLLIVKKINIFSLISISYPKEITVGGVPITVNKRNKKLAYQIWVELKTRKIALDFDEDNDVITEVYDSWYESFKLIREYVKDIGEKSINNNLREISLSIINDTMRPHLTKYQSRFRRWFDKNYEVNLTVQEKQKDYPDYAELVNDLRKVNIKCQEYLVLLEKIYK